MPYNVSFHDNFESVTVYTQNFNCAHRAVPRTKWNARFVPSLVSSSSSSVKPSSFFADESASFWQQPNPLQFNSEQQWTCVRSTNNHRKFHYSHNNKPLKSSKIMTSFTELLGQTAYNRLLTTLQNLQEWNNNAGEQVNTLTNDYQHQERTHPCPVR